MKITDLAMVKVQLPLPFYHDGWPEVGYECAALVVRGVAPSVVHGAAVVEGGAAGTQGLRGALTLYQGKGKDVQGWLFSVSLFL